jgi:hypothetical protein
MVRRVLTGVSLGFTSLTDDEARELHRLSGIYWKKARRCEEAKSYLSGSVMLGLALEAFLLLTVYYYDDDAEGQDWLPIEVGEQSLYWIGIWRSHRERQRLRDGCPPVWTWAATGSAERHGSVIMPR